MLIRAPCLTRKNMSTLSQPHVANSSSSPFASFRSRVSNPSVSQPYSARAANGGASHSVLPCINKECDDGLFTKSFGSFQPVQTLNKHKARTVRPDQDRRLQTLVENAGRDLVYSFLFEARAPLDRNVDVGDWDGLALHHDRLKRTG